MTDENLEEITLEVNEILAAFSRSKGLTADVPQSCAGTLIPWNDVMRGQITSEIQMAHAYYLDPRNNEGTFAERRAKLDEVVRATFSKFINDRKREYESVRCRYRGTQSTHRGTKTTTLTCQPDFVFVRSSLVHTQNGDWKGGPYWTDGDTKMGWSTGGHRPADTFAEVDAVYADIPGRVLAELNTARAVLQDRGIATELPLHVFNQD